MKSQTLDVEEEPIVGKPIDAPGEYALLREIVVGEEREGLEELRARFDAFERDFKTNIGDRLIGAIETHNAEGAEAQEEFGKVLRAPVEEAIKSSIAKDRTRLSTSLFPIMGPAMRDYVAALFKGMSEDLNEVIRNTTSISRVRWRLEAKLAGKPFSEYLLLKTLNYRVEEVFLMQGDTGMLLQHIAREGGDTERDAELVSGMFSAIRSFVQDSFGKGSQLPAEGETAESEDELGRFSFGSKEVIIDAGPSAIIAASVEGTPPPDFRSLLRTINEELHTGHADTLEDFSGDPDEMEFSRPIIERAMIENSAEEDAGGGLWRLWLLLGLIAAGLIALGVVKWVANQKESAFLDSLRAEPGIEGVRLEKRGDGKVVTGLRDPLAVDPASAALAAGFEAGEFQFDFAPYHSVGTEFERSRSAAAEEETKAALASDRAATAAEMLRHSRMLAFAQVRSHFAHIETLSMELDGDGVIVLGGAVKEPYFSTIHREVSPYSDVFSKVDTAGLSNATDAEISRLLNEIGSLKIRYASGSAVPAAGAEATIDRIADAVVALDECAAYVGKSATLDIRAVPLTGKNLEYLAETARARLVDSRDRLVARGVPPAMLTPINSAGPIEGEPGAVYVVPTIVPSETRPQ